MVEKRCFFYHKLDFSCLQVRNSVANAGERLKNVRGEYHRFATLFQGFHDEFEMLGGFQVNAVIRFIQHINRTVKAEQAHEGEFLLHARRVGADQFIQGEGERVYSTWQKRKRGFCA